MTVYYPENIKIEVIWMENNKGYNTGYSYWFRTYFIAALQAQETN
jgi:hypothetical protein